MNLLIEEAADFIQRPGIDKALAENIISLRSQIGGFVVVEELSLAEVG